MKPVFEHLPLGKERSIHAFHYEQEHFETPWHFHPQHELTLIRESTGTKLVGDYVGSYVPGEMVLLRSNVPHCWKNHKLEGQLAKSTVVQWTPGIYPKVPELKGVFNLLQAAARGLIFNRETTAGIVPILIQLPELQGAKAYTALLDLLVQLTESTAVPLSKERFTTDLADRHGGRMARVQAFVATEYSRKIYLQEVAALVSMTEQSFSRFFSKMMGRPFFSYLNVYRTNAASRMLINTDKSVAEIGYACGYESLPFFYQQFLKYQGSSPAKYRKRHLERRE